METLKERITKVLLQLPNVKSEDLDAVFALQNTKGLSLGRALIERKIISEKDLMILLVRELHIPSIDLSKYKFDQSLKVNVPERLARQYRIMPISQLRDTITIAISDPLNVFAIDDIKSITGKSIDVVMGTDTQIMNAINQFYGSGDTRSVAQVSKEVDIEDFKIISGEEIDQGAVAADTEAGEQAPVIRMVNLIIKEAIKQRASDIHMEPTSENMRVRYRIDGILQDILNVPKDSQNSVIVRLKIMSRLDITSHQTPQDGRFKMRISGQEYDFRVSMLPTTFGQKVVMRILDKANLSIGLANLGFSPSSVEILNEAIVKPFGMILVTGPTGSGKSTTLYSVINKLNTVDKNIITIEDPVEYLLEGLTQIEARPEIGLTFAAGLRALLRQSPDIVMVGEIRDSETADIAIKASLTGQLVLSTLHTNDAAGALTRLVDMGVEPFLVASSLICVLAQRLCRRLCKHCKEPVHVPPDLYKKIEHRVKPNTVFYEGKGCDRCRHTGYQGRMGVTEILVIDDAIREMLLGGKSSDEIRRYAQMHNGMTLLFDDMVDKIAQGQTTVTEMFRITSND